MVVKNQQALTLKDFKEVIIPAMEKVFATKKDLENFLTKKESLQFLTTEQALKFLVTKQELRETEERLKQEVREKFDKVLDRSDHILKDLETLKTEKVIGDYQVRKRIGLLKIIVSALRKHKILTLKQLAVISSY